MSQTNFVENQISQLLSHLKMANGSSLTQWISSLQIENGLVTIIFETPPELAKEAEELRLKAEEIVRQVDTVRQVRSLLTTQRAAKALPTPKLPEPLAGIKHIIAIASGKGGVGKSTTAANLAISLSNEGKFVGILDADIYGPSLPRLFSITQKPDVNEDKKLIPISKYGIACMSIGFMVREEKAMIWRGPMVHSALKQMLFDVAWPELDLLIIDMPPGTGDAQLTICQQVKLDGAVIVSTPQDLALIDARRGLQMFQRVDIPVLGLIENMSQFSCPSCGHVSAIFSHGGAKKEAESLNIPFLGELPLDLSIRLQSDQGIPVTAAKPDSPVSQAYANIAQKILELFS